MSCYITADKFIPAVKMLIALDSEKYRDYNNAAKFLRQNISDPQQLTETLLGVASIYTSLQGLDPEFYQLGQAPELLKIQELSISPTLFLDAVNELLPSVKPAKLLEMEQITRALNSLYQQDSPITSYDTDKILGMISQYVQEQQQAKLLSDAELEQVHKQFMSALRHAVSNYAAEKDLLLEDIAEHEKSFTGVQSFVPLDSELLAEVLPQWNTYLVKLTNGVRVEAVLEDGGFKRLLSNGEAEEIPQELIQGTPVLARPKDSDTGNWAEQVFYPHQLTGGLVFKAIDGTSQSALHERLAKLKHPELSIKVTAVKLEDFNDDRLARLHELARTDERFAGLLNRQHETFENPAQQRKLQEDPNAEVLTVSRPTTEQGFYLLGEIADTGETFVIYGPQNFTVVDAQNKTTVLDLKKPEHQQWLQKLSVVHQYSEDAVVETPITTEQVTTLSRSNDLFQQLRASVIDQLALDPDMISKDVTEQFRALYSFARDKPEKIITSLDDYLQTADGSRISWPVMIGEVDAHGEVVAGSVYSRGLPLIFYRYGQENYMRAPLLKGNERIMHTDKETGVTTPLSIDGYIDDVLGITQEKIESIIGKENYPAVHTFALGNSEKAGLHYIILEQKRMLTRVAEFSSLMLDLHELLRNPAPDNKSQNKRWVEMGKQRFAFRGNDKNLIAEFNSVPLRDEDGTVRRHQLVVEVRSLKGYNIHQNKHQFNFPLNQELVDQMIAHFATETPAIKNLKNTYPTLEKLNLSKPDQQRKFYQVLDQLVKAGDANADVQEVLRAARELEYRFGSMLKEEVGDKLLLGATNEQQEQLTQAFTSPTTGEVQTFLLVAERVKDETGVEHYVPKITLPRLGQEGVVYREDYRTDISTYNTKTIPYRPTVSAVPKSRMTPMPVSAAPVGTASAVVLPEVVTPAPVASAPADNVQASPKTASAQGIKKVDRRKLSLQDRINSVATPEQIDRETTWLQEKLPQFGLSEDDVRSVLDLTTVDGHVLGLIKDRMIYLNRMLTETGTVYHEAFHGVFRYLMSDAERQEALQVVMKDRRYDKQFTPEALQEFARKRNLELDGDLLNLVAEEILADRFKAYMVGKTAPKNFLGKFFAALRKLLNLFRVHQKEIDSLFERIDRGYYSGKELVDREQYKGQVALELIDGVEEYAINPETHEIEASNSVLTVAQQNELIYQLAFEVVHDETDRSVKEKLEDARKRLYTERFSTQNVEQLIAQNPGEAQNIRAYFKPLYNNYSFMLGALLDGQKLTINNLTGDPSFDENEPEHEDLGQESLDALSKQVLSLIEHFDVKRRRVENEEGEQPTNEEVNDMVEGSYTPKSEAAQDAEDDTSGGVAENFETTFNGINALDNIRAEMKRFFSLVRYKYTHPELGITFEKMVDGSTIFLTMMKVTAGVAPENIVARLKSSAAQFAYDGNQDAADSLAAVYQKLYEICDLDENLLPRQNEQLYRQLVDVFHNAEIEYVVANHTLTETTDDKGNLVDVQTFAKLSDVLLKSDLGLKKRALVGKLNATYKRMGSDPAYNQAVRVLENLKKNPKSNPETLQKAQEKVNSLKKNMGEKQSAYQESTEILRTLSNNIVGTSSVKGLLNGRLNPGQVLEDLTTSLHNNLTKIGLEFPKSLIRMSLLAIEIQENGLMPAGIPQHVLEHYAAHKDLIAEGKYLQKDFFEDLKKITQALKEGQRKETIYKMTNPDATDDGSELGETAKRFNAVLGLAGVYMVKYDPKDSPSTVRNAEGKPIYRYVKYTPAVLMASEIRQNGLGEHLKTSLFAETYLNSWYLDNPLISAGWDSNINSVAGTREQAQARLYFKNFKVSALGGVQQFHNDRVREGATFKTMSQRDLYVMSLLAFQQREIKTDLMNVKLPGGKIVKERVSVELYTRSLTQLEASSTNFLVNAVYQPYYDHTGKALLYQGDYLAVTKTLEDVTRQEYNRMAREWKQKDDRLKQHELTGDRTNLINTYNAKVGKNGKVLVTLPDGSVDTALKAYKFNLLSDFFSPANALTDLLRDEALKGTRFEDLSAEMMKTLRTGLSRYAEEQFQAHLTQLEGSGLVSVVDKPMTTKVKLPDGTEEEKVLTRADGTPRTVRVLSSDLLPDEIKVEGRVKNRTIAETYGLKDGVGNLEAMLRDYFFNTWSQGLLVNQVFDGDMGMNVKDAIDYFKRNKALLASGSTMKEGYHKTAVIEGLQVIMHPDKIELGQWDTLDDLRQEITDAREFGHVQRAEELEQVLGELEHLEKTDPKSMVGKIFDGQTISTMHHQIDQHNSLGRLNTEHLELLIKKCYMPLTQQEVKTLERAGIVNNSKKTVTATREQYIKQSEHLLDRGDISVLAPQPGQSVKQAREALHQLYLSLYNLRQQQQSEWILNSRSGIVDPRKGPGAPAREQEIQDVVMQIHEYWAPKPHRKQLHELLNSMEYHAVDQLMDVEASKKATLLPVSVSDYSGLYMNLNKSAALIDNRFKYFQVETAGVHDHVKASVQAKLLIVANLNQLRESLGEELTPEEQLGLEQVTGLLAKYQNSLSALTQSNFDKMKTFLRDENGNFDVKEVYDMIRTSLEEQKADTNKLKLFAIDPVSGKPVHDLNQPAIRKILEYYFFSIYSNNVTDEKVAGFKNFHVTSYGYKLLYDKETGEVVPTEEYDKNPDAYSEQYYGTRYPGVEVTRNSDGIPTGYLVEVIMPKPFFENDSQEQLYNAQLRTMFGTRIPTEDKRSMVAMKVVDHIDSSYLNTIIVPQLVHVLSGSDLDIDSLYGQKFDSYRDSSGTYHKFGDYSTYLTDNVEEAKFLELLHFVGKHPNYAHRIKEAKKTLEQSGVLSPSRETLEQMVMMGFTQADFDAFNKLPEEQALHTELDQDYKQKRKAAKEQQARYEEAKTRLLENQQDAALKNDARFSEDQWIKLKELRNEAAGVRSQQRELVKYLENMRDTMVKLNLLNEALGDLPFGTFEKFQDNPAYHNLVTPVHQNENLSAKIQILSNPAVFRGQYISERSSVDRFKSLLNITGVSPKDLATMYNAFTIDGIVNVRGLNAMNKTGISQTANLNKFFALATQYNLKLNSGSTIWSLTDKEGNTHHFDTFGGRDEDGVLSITHIGNILGMFADGAKDPIPGALGMNEANSPVILAMIGLGLPVEMAVFSTFFPEVRQAVATVQSADFAISETFESERKFLGGELQAVIKKHYLDSKDQTVIKELESAGILLDANAFKFDVDMSKVKITYKKPADKSLNMDQINRANVRDSVTPQQLGFSVSVVDPEKSGEPQPVLSPTAQKLVLLSLVKKQADQSSKISSAGKVVNLVKKLNPSFPVLDKMITSIEELQDPELSIFSNGSVLFEEGQVWKVLNEMLGDLNRQSEQLFIERAPAFQPFKRLFGGLFKDPSQMAGIITGFFTLKKLREDHNAHLDLDDPNIKADLDNFREFYKPDYWFGVSSNPENITTIEEDLNSLDEEFKGNRMLAYLRLRHLKGRGKKYNAVTGKLDGGKGETYIEMASKGKFTTELTEGMIDDGMILQLSRNPKVWRLYRKLFAHELIRGGLQPKPGMFMNLLNTDLLRESSRFIGEFVSHLQNSTSSESFQENLMNYLKLDQHQDYAQMLDHLIFVTASMALRNNQTARVATAKRISFNNSTGFQSALMGEVKGDLTKAKEVVGHVFELEDLKKMSNTGHHELWSARAGDSVKVNLVATERFTENMIQKVASTMGIEYNNDERHIYSFPIVMKAVNEKGVSTNGSNQFILRSVDGVPVSTLMMRQLDDPESMSSKQQVKLNGKKAVYDVLSADIENTVVSPLAFTREEQARYAQLRNGQVVIGSAPVVKTTPVEATSLLTDEEAPDERVATPEEVQLGESLKQQRGAQADGFVGQVPESEPVTGDSEVDDEADQVPTKFDDIKGMMERLRAAQEAEKADVITTEIPKNEEVTVGRYVQYKDKTYIVTKFLPNGLVQVYSPVGGENEKLSIKLSSIDKVLGSKATVLNYKNADYMVTPSNSLRPSTIISMTSNRAMTWDEGNGNRQGLLKMKTAYDNLDLSNDDFALQVFMTSSQKLTLPQFRREAQNIINNMLSESSHEEILERLSCL